MCTTYIPVYIHIRTYTYIYVQIQTHTYNTYIYVHFILRQFLQKKTIYIRIETDTCRYVQIRADTCKKKNEHSEYYQDSNRRPLGTDMSFSPLDHCDIPAADQSCQYPNMFNIYICNTSEQQSGPGPSRAAGSRQGPVSQSASHGSPGALGPA